MPLMPELQNSEALQTFMSVSTTVSPISFKSLLTAQLDFTQTLVLSGNLIQILGVPQETCKSIQHLVMRRELDCARHLRVNIDLSRPPIRKYFECISGTISIKLLSHLHEVLETVRVKMWNQGTSDSFYPPEARQQNHFITQFGSRVIKLPHYYYVFTIDILLSRNGSSIGTRQPDAGLAFVASQYHFLVLEIAFSESEEHIISKAKEAICCF